MYRVHSKTIRLKASLFILIISFIVILSCNEKNVELCEISILPSIDVPKVRRTARDTKFASIIRRNVTVSDTFFLYKKDFPRWDASYYVHHFRTYEEKYYNRLIPKVRYENFSLSNNPYSNPNWDPKSKKTKLEDFPTLWTELIYYSEEYYLKFPSDFCGLNQKIVTDSCLIQKTCEGPLPIQLNSVSKLRSNQYVLNLEHKLFNLGSTTVTIIDTFRGIAIWQNSKDEFELLADVNKFRRLPIVKADCNKNKCSYEMKSDSIDFHELIHDAITTQD